MAHIIIRRRKYRDVQPSNIATSGRHFFDAFDHYESEISAHWIIRFLKDRKDGWLQFSYKALNDFYKSKFSEDVDDFSFNNLITRGWIIIKREKERGDDFDEAKDNDILSVTDDFIERCYKASKPK